MSNKPITIKVPTAKLLEALNKALAERKKSLLANEKAWKDYDNAVKDFHDKLAEQFRSGKGKVARVSKAGWREEGNKWELVVEYPSSVKPPTEPETGRTDWSTKHDVEELENAIALLSLSDDEYASTSTYKGVARFIK